MKKTKFFFLTLLAGLLMSVSAGAAVEMTKVATMQDMIGGTTVTTDQPTVNTGYKTDVTGGGIYDFSGSQIFQQISNQAVVDALGATNQWFTVAVWIYGKPTRTGGENNNCLLGYGESGKGFKIYTRPDGTLRMTTKWVSDYDGQVVTMNANQWNLVAISFYTSSARTISQVAYFAGATDGQFWTKTNKSSTWNDPSTKKFAIGSQDMNSASENFNGTMANFTIMTSTSKPNNSDIANCIGAAPSFNGVTVTYNYTFGGKTIKSENFDVVSGVARPTASASMVPYACEADYTAVPETVTETATYDVPIKTTSAFPFEFSTDFASAKWNTWRMANRTGAGGAGTYKGYVWNNGKKYQQTDLDAQPTDAKYLYAFVGTPYGFTIMTADGNYVYTTCKNAADLVTASEGTEFVALASKKTSGWGTGYEKYFYFKGANANGSINEMDKSDGYRKVGYWDGGGYDDNGSLIAIEAVSVKAYKVVFAEGTPETGKVTFSGNDVTRTSTVKAFSSEAAITVADLTVGAVEGYTPNTPVIADNVITVSYTLNKSQAWADLDAKITEAKAITVPTGPWGTNPGHFNQTACEGFPGAITAAEDVLNNSESTDDDYTQATETLQAAIDALAMVKHQEGKFYTIKGLNENYPWITEQSAGAKSIRVSANADDAGIFYYTPEHNLLGFQSGDYLCYKSNGAFNISAGENDVIVVTESAGNGRFYISTYVDDGQSQKYIYLHNNNTDQKTHEGTKNVTKYNAYTFTEVTSLPITIGSTGYATFSAPVDVEIPSDVTAFIASSYSNPTLTMTSIETGKIPANTGVVLKATAGTYYFNVTTDAEAVGTNSLKPVIATQDVEATADYTALILATSGSSVAFYPLSSDSKTVKGHRAYLELLTAELPTSGEAKVNVLWDDVTGIESIHNAEFIIQNSGKFLENGKIVIVKNNKKFNVAGQMIK